MIAPLLQQLVDDWRRLAAAQRAEFDQRGAELNEKRAAELEARLREHGAIALTIQQAAEESGLSEDHLRRQVRDGVISNAGRKGKPMICRSDLPRRAATTLAHAAEHSYDALADARFLLDRRRG